MLKRERHTHILELLEKKTFMTVSDIATELNVSEMTIRRDINELSDSNKLVRLYGGAQKLGRKDKELATHEKINLHIEQKEYIGKIMNSLIQENQVVFVGAGTTILYALPFIQKKGLMIVTNSLIAFNYIIKHTDYRVLLTGGDFTPITEEFIGEHAEQTFESINIDIAFAATNGIYNNNVTTSNYLEGGVQRAAFKSAKKKVVVADSTKFNVSDVYTFYKLSDLDCIITDNKIDEQTFKFYQSFGPLLNKIN
ncbi:DeoR/GlpR family DNA-binding transcription regulator [Enterococcus rivorum]|uniref:Lactose phosphotransferase system repressor n=1 Tax=Enterococcus rivorum TaxID=762845 RepID=A0A1E5KWM6_9ENTE|nr:DeoR/GlpR family DNA-binding transcription regulator [Enterococcus rivorum]MBP2099126.1 DeoR family lactose phosphotransferase system repressor [Enterococcus rivorum]OEH82276.1 DeoR family transcriptional regulator [Enterococcus rivorum]